MDNSFYYPLLIYFILLVYDMWMFIKQDNLENAMLMVITTAISIIPWVYMIYDLGRSGYIGKAWLSLIPKLFGSILGAYLMLKSTEENDKDGIEERFQALLDLDGIPDTNSTNPLPSSNSPPVPPLPKTSSRNKELGETSQVTKETK